MTELTLTSFNGIETVDSKQVAEAVGKEHKNLIRDIAKYCEYLGELNFELTDFFIESTYISEQNKQLPCYLCTRKGCEMIANKLTGQKGVAFTALYITAFHAMEDHIKHEPAQLAEKQLQIAEMEIRLKMSQQLSALSAKTASDTYKSVLLAKSAEILMGEPVLPLPKSEKTYSAGDIAKMLGVSAQKIGRIANANGMKTSEYGAWYHDKSAYSAKEVDVFRYTEQAIEKFKELI